MLERRSQFLILPNEIIYNIFDYLRTDDVVRVFVFLNHRYATLVRSHVKYLDLTESWTGNREELWLICDSIEIMKINRLNLYILNNYRFNQLNILYLINVIKWYDIVCKMNLEKLTLSFDNEDTENFCFEKALVPSTVSQFSANAVLDRNAFHENLIKLNICIYSMIDLFEIVQRIPNVQYLTVTFADNFHCDYQIYIHQPKPIDDMIIDCHRLNSLTYLSINTKHLYNRTTNERMPFIQIELFIDHCCSNRTILKIVEFKFQDISFDQDIWSTIVRYKKTYNHFNFYASFIFTENNIEFMQILSEDDQFEYHIEGMNSDGRGFLHVYSLPFHFDTLYGFSSCSKLSFRCSFKTVRHLYFVREDFTHRISFKLLTKHMPNLSSIYYTLRPIVNIDREIFEMFDHVDTLTIISRCNCGQCVFCQFFMRLIAQMPNLKCLKLYGNAFFPQSYRFPCIKQFEWPTEHIISSNVFIQYFPNLMSLHLRYKSVLICPYELSQLIRDLFNGLPLLNYLSFNYSSQSDNAKHDKSKTKQALALTQTLNHGLRHLHLYIKPEKAIFHLPNPNL